MPRRPVHRRPGAHWALAAGLSEGYRAKVQSCRPRLGCSVGTCPVLFFWMAFTRPLLSIKPHPPRPGGGGQDARMYCCLQRAAPIGLSAFTLPLSWNLFPP